MEPLLREFTSRLANGRRQQLGGPKIQQPRRAVFHYQDVVRLQVAMYDEVLMTELNRLANPHEQRQALRLGKALRLTESMDGDSSNMAERAPQPFTCPRSGTSRARSSGTMAGSSTPIPIPLMRRIPTMQRLISTTHSYGSIPPKFRLN
jgi:hypothetical protein